jgi:uncharacterized protein Veg
MKRILILALTLSLLTIFVGCNNVENEVKRNNISNSDLVNTDNQIQNKTFIGTVVESDNSYIIVEPNEDEEERKSSDKFRISLGENNDMLYSVGQKLKITHTGFIEETYPAQIDIIDISLDLADSFEIVFCESTRQKDIREKSTIISNNETDKYNYNVYAYDGSVSIRIDNKEEISLRDALLEEKITMNQIISKANRDLSDKIIEGDFYKDGGSAIYKYPTYTIIKMHTLDGNRDVYIGKPNMTMKNIK